MDLHRRTGSTIGWRNCSAVHRTHVDQCTLCSLDFTSAFFPERDPTITDFFHERLLSNTPSATNHPLIGFTTLPRPAIEHGMVCRTARRRRELQCFGSTSDLARPGQLLNSSHVTKDQRFVGIQQTVDQPSISSDECLATDRAHVSEGVVRRTQAMNHHQSLQACEQTQHSM